MFQFFPVQSATYPKVKRVRGYVPTRIRILKLFQFMKNRTKQCWAAPYELGYYQAATTCSILTKCCNLITTMVAARCTNTV